MLDQYGKTVPRHLALLGNANPTDFAPEELKQVENARWYEFEHDRRNIWIALDDLSGSVAGFFEDRLQVLAEHKVIYRIAEALKRYSAEDGFYHA